MKTPEDEAFDEIAKRQGGFQAKRAMAAAKLLEPVAWIWKDMRGQDIVSLFEPRLNSIPLYAAPPQRPWVGLTDEDCKGMNAGDKVVAMWANRILKEKNT